MRRLGDAAVVFNAATWETHVLPPAAAVVAEVIAEISGDLAVSPTRVREALRRELDIDPDQPQIRELLRMLGEIGLLGE